MPTLLLKITPQQTEERYQSLAVALTSLTAATLGKRAEVTAVMIDDLELNQWSIGGRLPSNPTAMLEISITAGTNSEDEKARFIAAAFHELQRQLAPNQTLESASYVIVRELPASDWGFGGQTQLARRIAQRQAP